MSNEPTTEMMDITIARFMGMEGTDDFIRQNYKYHKSWELLMPVWVKWRRDASISKEAEKWTDSLGYYLLTSDEPKRFCERLYYAIQWLNQQKQTNG